MQHQVDTHDLKTLQGAQIIQDEGYIDGITTKEIQQNLRRSRQNGHIPTTAEEKTEHRALNRKLEMFVLAFCALIYIFNGLDRSNNSQLLLARRLGRQDGWASSEWVGTEGQMVALRLLLGVLETGMYPTVVSYLSTFYPRYDMAFRVALFYGSYACATAFGGLIAYGCFQIKGSLHGWQYLFIIEGAGSIIVAIATPFWLPADPASAWFLSETERNFAENRMTIDAEANLGSTHKVTRRDIKEAILDWKLWLMTPANILQGISPMGLTIFFPIVIKGLGFSGPNANLMTVPPYVVATICVLCVAYVSDHYKTRMWPILGGLILVMVGLAITIALPLDNVGGRYAGLVILVAGSFIPSPLEVAWLSGNTPEPGKRTVVLGINGWGNISGVIGSQIFLVKYGPTYRIPLAITLGLAGLSLTLFATNGVVLRFVNQWKAKKIAAMTLEEIEEENTNDLRYGDKKYTFIYGW